MKSVLGFTALLVFYCLKPSPGLAQVDSVIVFPSEPSVLVSALFVNFSCDTRDSKKVSLEWEVDSISEGDYFIVERSNQGARYESIGALRGTLSDTHYELMDNSPPSGTNFYRIRFANKIDRGIYSRAIPVNIMGEVDFRFYPNPVDKLLIVRTEHLIDIQVIDAYGTVRLSKRLQKGIQVIDAGNLEKGSYVLRVADKESNRVVSSQLLKN